MASRESENIITLPEKFDGYYELPDDLQEELDADDARLDKLDEGVIENILERGKILKKWQDRLASHDKTKGMFQAWIKKQRNYSVRAAYRYISAHEVFGCCATVAQHFKDASALYLLSAPKTPQSAKNEALKRLEAGTAITHKDAKALVAKYQLTASDSAEAEGQVEWSDSEKERRDAVNLGQTVVANLHRGKDEALRAWATEKGIAVRIDRIPNSRSDWENPFIVDADGTREEVIEHYKWFYDHKPSLKAQINTLHGKVLLCWCHPLECHGNFLAEETMDIPELF